MGSELIHQRFAAVSDLLDDMEVVADEETVSDIRERTRELEADYVDAFEGDDA